jgi:hypothetical protein
VAGKLPDTQAQNASKDLIDTLAEPRDPESKSNLARGLTAITDKLSRAQAQSAFKVLIDALPQANDNDGLRNLAGALAAVAGKLPNAQAQSAFKDLVDALAKTQDLKPNSALLRRWLPSRESFQIQRRMAFFRISWKRLISPMN